MSQTKAQLIQPIGVVTASGVVVSGVMTAGTFDGDVVGSATSIIQGSNLNLGAFNATSFAGDFTGNATGIITSSAIKVGQLTASSFVGDFTGTATSMARGTGFEAGTVTSTAANVTYTVTVGSKTGGGNAFYIDGVEAPVITLYPGATYTFDQAAGTNDTHPLRLATAADAAGSTEYTDGVTTNGTPGTAGAYTRIVVPRNAPTPLYYYCSNHSGMGNSINITNQLQGNVTGNVTGNTTGLAGSVTQGINIHVGVITATSLHGDGSNMTGIAATNFNTQTVTANGAATTIDLSAGNVLTFNQSADTTVSFANTSEAMDVTIIRIKDASTTARTITWPDSVKWDGGSAPTLISDSESGDSQLFQFLTRDSGLTWYAWEPYNVDFSRLRLLTWGQNSAGNLALGDKVNRSSPTQVGGLSHWANTAGQQMNKSGDQGGGALKSDGTLWCWGQNLRGNLGQNEGGFPASYSSPVQVAGTTWSSWSTGYQGGVISTKTDGTLWSWGRNGTGQSGQNDRTDYSSPVQIPGTNWTTGDSTKIATNLSAGAINTSNELFRMGYNNWGELGLNDRAWRSSPTQIPGTWKCIDVEHFTAGGIKTNGTMWTWGQNYYGVLGLNGANPAHKSSPAQVGTDTTWSQFHFGEETAIAIKTNGTLWAWGRNDSSAAGNLGLNDQVQRSSPTQVGTDTTWSQVNGSQARSFTALKTDGSLWVWGNGSGYGNLGLNVCTDNTPYLSSPTQLPGTYERIISNSRGFAVLKQP